MLTYTLNKKQYEALEGLAFWVADEAYIIERWGINEPERMKARNTVLNCCFPECDALNVPFWVQNVVICFSENWRQYKEIYLDQFLKSKNIFVGGGNNEI